MSRLKRQLPIWEPPLFQSEFCRLEIHSTFLPAMAPIKPTLAAPRKEYLVINSTQRSWQQYYVNQPHTDMDRYIHFTYFRFFMSFIGFALLLSDIPRTGFGIESLVEYGYPKVAPEVVTYFGPYAYPSVHVAVANDSGTQFSARAGSRELDAIPLWSFKYDSLSIAPRALARELNLSSFSDCVMYRAPCPVDSTLSFAQVFHMIDDLMDGVKSAFFDPVNGSSPTRRLPVVYRTQNHWLDRLHHFVYTILWKHVDYRFHSAFYYDAQDVSKHGVCLHQESFRPYFCDHEVGWDVPPDMYTNQNVQISEHISRRIQHLEAEYSQLSHIELLILNTHYAQSSRQRELLPTARFTSEGLETATFIRGLLCEANNRSCRTIFVDDYRYERGLVKNNAEEWYYVTGTIRAASQAYVWLRVVSLWIGCFKARSSERLSHQLPLGKRVYKAWVTFFKIPSHTVVYGSWFPIIGYALAHFIDSGLIHMVSDSMWASVGGSLDFDLFTYIRLASIQMRNVWFIAFSIKLVVLFQTSALYPRGQPWTARNGMFGIRGMFIGATSWLTIFGNFRALMFRDTDILNVTMLPRHIPWAVMKESRLNNQAEFGFRYDVKTMIAAGAIVLTMVAIVKVTFLIWQHFRKNATMTSVLGCTSYYVPFSAGSLWSCSTLCIYWRVWVNYKRSDRLKTFDSRPIEGRISLSEAIPNHKLEHRSCSDCKHWTQKSWQKVQGCATHEHIFDICHRSSHVWTVLRLINIAMMTDPAVLLYLYGVGRTLYVYEVRKSTIESIPDEHGELKLRASTTNEILLSPCTRRELEDYCDGEDLNDLTLLGPVDSRCVGWSALINCG